MSDRLDQNNSKNDEASANGFSSHETSHTDRRASAIRYRLRAAIVLIGVIALLGVAAWLDVTRLEDPRHGYSFLKPCGFLVRTGYPCPTCYMTRAFTHMMHGHPLRSFAMQPFGAAMCVAVMYLGYGAVRVLITGRPWVAFWTRWRRRTLILWVLGLLLATWIFVIVSGMMSGTLPMTRWP